MANPTINPFRFGDPVEGDFYLNRNHLTRAVGQFLDNRIHVVLMGPRRFGKTSFVLNLLEQRGQEAGTECLFIDIFNITSHRDFLQQLLRGLKNKRTWTRNIAEAFRAIPRLRPRVSVDIDPDTQQLSFGFSAELDKDKDIKESIQDILSALGSLGKKVIVAIDEFQKAAEIEDHGWLEATLRTQMQHLENVSFIFTGSRKSIISDMLNNPARPFYRSCQIIEFPAFGDEFTDWIIERFKVVNVKCDRPAIDYLRARLQNTPNYVQMACFHLVAEGTTHVTKEEVEKILKTIVRQNAYAYQTLLASLTSMQQRVLRLAAIESEQIFSKENIAKYEISSGPALASSLKSLKVKQILDEGSAKGKVIFDDPLFAIWLRHEFEN